RVGGTELEGVWDGDRQPRTTVLSPTELEEPLAPRLHRHFGEELLRAFRLAVLSRPGRKNPLTKGRSTSWVAKHSGHSISMVVSTPHSTRPNAATRKSASRLQRSSRYWRVALGSAPSMSKPRYD